MSGTEFAKEGVLGGVAKLLGLPDAAALADVKPSGLYRLTQRELLDVAKTLGLSKVSRLKKEALLARVWERLAEATGDSAQKASGNGVAMEPSTAARVANPITDDVPAAARITKSPDTQPTNGHRDGAPQTVPAPAQPSPQDTRESRPGAAHKFDVGEGAEVDLSVLRAESEAKIPWGYGRDLITAMPVDPERLYAYWEVTDDAIARARGGLGPGGDTAYLCLRLHDVTGRIFDGTNAHAYFDLGIDRSLRQYFFHVGKPTSEAIVEIGMKSHEGYFVRMARSGRVTFPRRGPAYGGEPEWMTVRVGSGEVEGRHSGSSRGSSLAGPGTERGEGAEAAGVFPQGAGVHERLPDLRRLLWGRVDNEAYPSHLVRWEEIAETEIDAEVMRTWSWQGDVERQTWSAGPFSFPVEMPSPVQESHSGPTRIFRSGSRTHVVWGPWQVVIKGIGAHAEREVLGQWEIYRTWSGTSWQLLPRTPGEARPGAGSEARLGASELRLGGASERYRLGASELRLGGASERSFIGSSEYQYAGSSERRFSGSSEIRLGGASEARLGGGSEDRLGGGSEGRLGGSSEARLRGDDTHPASEAPIQPVVTPPGGWPLPPTRP